MTDDRKKYLADYQRTAYTSISFKVRTIEDNDIIQILNNVPNKSEYIKKLIRDDVDR